MIMLAAMVVFTICLTIYAFQFWRKEGWVRLFSIYFAICAVGMAGCVYDGIRELLIL